MKVITAYSPKSSVTGRALKEKFEALRKRTNRKAKCDLFIRWGSTEAFSNLKHKKELNTLEAVKRTTDKHEMLKVLSAAGISTPRFNSDPSIVAEYQDESGNFYIRSKAGVVRYSNDFDASRDAYYSMPIPDKRREYRVHVFNGKVIGIYEKVPNEAERPKLFKSDTCKFVRCNPEISRVDQAAQEMCIASVSALGLLFGGCDLVRTKDAQFIILEVNSAPGLNSVMLDKYAKEMEDYFLQPSLS